MKHLDIGRTCEKAPLLVIVPSVTMNEDGNRYFLDRKAVSGLYLYSKFWPGRVRCIFKEGDRSALHFGRLYEPSELPFEVQRLPPNTSLPDEFISDASIVLASGDNWLHFPMADQALRLGIPLCYVIEYILETRLQIVRLSDASLVGKAKSFLWNVMMERRRRRAFTLSNGLQSNGTPAAEAYSGYAPNILTYFDNRLSKEQMATEHEIAIKCARLENGLPLRLAYTGRLEKMKGADDLIRIALALEQAGKSFRLDVYGVGSLEAEMRAALNNATAAPSLREKVHIHEPIDFDLELVPWLRSEVDLFLCCHRQSDPSCTYLETLGCGVPILGYDNRAWRGILNRADVGWITTRKSPNEVVRKIVDLDTSRSELIEKMQKARNFATAHSFENEFKSRVDHLWETAKDYTQRRAESVGSLPPQ